MAGVGVGNAFLPTAGGAMAGDIDMANHKITNLPDAVDLGDPVNFKEYSLNRDNIERLTNINSALPGILYTDMVIGLFPAVKNATYANNGEITSVMDVMGKHNFISGNQPPLLQFDEFNQPFFNFNGEIGCDLIAPNINGGSLGGVNRNTTTMFFICKNRMRQTGSAFFWGDGNKRFSMHIQNDDRVSIDYGVYPNARVNATDMDTPLESRLEAWAYVYDGATAALFRSDFHMPPDKVENFVSTISDSEESFSIGSMLNAPTYRGDMDFYGILIYPRAFAPNELTSTFKYLNSIIRGIGT